MAVASEGYRRAAARFIAECALAGFERLEHQRLPRGVKRVSTDNSTEETEQNNKRLKDTDEDTLLADAGQELTPEERKFRLDKEKMNSVRTE